METSTPLNNTNKAIVEALYNALSKGDLENVAKHLATDLEWWFHGPPKCHHMMKVLTGESNQPEFRFEPRSVTSINMDRVIAEGWEGGWDYWVHVWTLKNGLITQFREYFNTCLTVRDLRPLNGSVGWVNLDRPTLWQSRNASRSMPGLVLAI